MGAGITGPLRPIQVIPPGLMGLLQLKQEGRLPSALSDVVAPVIELRDWYLTARRLDDIALFGAAPTTGAIATGAIGFSALTNAIVPQGQIWYVEEMNVAANTAAAADTVRYCCALKNQGATVLMQLGPDFTDVVTARQRSVIARVDRGFWAFPGDAFGIQVLDISTAGMNFTGHMRATPLPI